jgi:hypothetical protein
LYRNIKRKQHVANLMDGGSFHWCWLLDSVRPVTGHVEA